DRAVTARDRLVECANDPPSLVDLRGGRAEYLVHHRDLIRMDERLAREAEAPGSKRIGAQAGGVRDVGPDAVEGELSCGDRRDDRRRARVQEVCRLALARGGEPEVQGE